MSANAPHDRRRLARSALLALAGIALLAAARVLAPEPRHDAPAATGALATEAPPPLLALSGSLRGLLVDALFVRAVGLREAGDHAEALQLARWITTLDPGFEEAWRWHAEHLAYDVAAAVRTPAERWTFVDGAVSLLRERGLAANPGSPELHRALAALLLVKLGGESEPYHWHLKTEFARRWHEILGPVPHDPVRRLKRLEAIAALEHVANTEEERARFLAEDPARRAAHERLREIGHDLDRRFLREIARRETWRSPEMVRTGGTPPGRDELDAWLEDPALAGARADLVALARARALGAYRNRASSLAALVRGEGILPDGASGPLPLDWRHPATHALLHAVGGASIARDPVEREALVRVALAALGLLVRCGTVQLGAVTGAYRQSAELRLLPAYHHAAGGEAIPERRRAPHRALLAFVARTAYVAGDRERAARTHALLRELYAGLELDRLDRLDPARAARDRLALDAWVSEELDSIPPHSVIEARALVDAHLQRAIHRGFAAGDAGARDRALETAGAHHRRHQERYGIPLPGSVREPLALPAFPEMLADAWARARNAASDAATPRAHAGLVAWLRERDPTLAREVQRRLAP